MNFSDPVANMLTSIRNKNIRKNRNVKVSYSKLKENVCKILKINNFLSEFWIDQKDEKRKIIKMKIKYYDGESRINNLIKISKPSKHIYLKNKEIKKYCKKYGFYIISTSKGLMTNKEALEQKIGGKLIFFIN